MRDRNPFNLLFFAAYWFIGGYVLMAFSPDQQDSLIVGFISLIVGVVLWRYVEGQWRRGLPVHGRFRDMLLTTPLILIILGVVLLIAESA